MHEQRDAGAVRRAAVLGLLPDALVLLGPDLTALDDNGVGRRWLGRPSAEPLDLRAHVHPADLPLLAPSTHGAGRWAAPVRVRVRHADGAWQSWSVQVDDRLGDPAVGALVVLARRAEDHAGGGPAESDTLLREVVAHVPVALVTLDPSGVVRFAAGEALEFYPDELVGRSLLDLTDSPEQAADLRAALAGNDVSAISYWAGRHWQGHYRPLWTGGTVTGLVAVFYDVTNQVRAEQARAQGEAHLRAVIEAAQEAIVVLDVDGRITSANAHSSRLLGTTVRPGADLRELLGDDAATEVVEAGLARRSPGPPDRYELRRHGATGEALWLMVSASPMLGRDGEHLGSVVVLTDITAHKAVERRLEIAARTDAVTGLANRVTVVDRLEHALARRTAGHVAVLFCDVDRLKATNDRFGHAAGDELLRHVARRARAVLRPADSLARYAGDEFVAVCEDLPSSEEALHLAERVRAAVDESLSVEGGRLTPTLSIGVALSGDGSTSEALLAAADAAAYAAKGAGRNTVRLAP